ncbi:hypothetical protein ACFQX8_19170 [Klenkia terrae]|uniref:WXG100 family type VII secretion target n=1 Tax=Klenkia terrae TaxID=1052259 RepID=UPI00360BCF4A
MPAPRTDGAGGGYRVDPVEAGGLDLRLLTITRIYPAVMLEDPTGMRDAAVAWQDLGGLLDAEARSLRRSLAGLGDGWRSEASTRFAERGAAAVGSLESWSEIAAARATELADLAVVVAGAKLRMQWIWDDFTRAAGAIADRPDTSGSLLGPAGTAVTDLVDSALVAGDLEDNVRRYTRQALDEVVGPLATRFAQSALTFAAPGPVFAGPTDAVVPGNATLAALVTGAWLPDGVGFPGGPAAPRIPMAPAVPVPRAASALPTLPTAPSMPPLPAPAMLSTPGITAAPGIPALPSPVFPPGAPVLTGRVPVAPAWGRPTWLQPCQSQPRPGRFPRCRPLRGRRARAGFPLRRGWRATTGSMPPRGQDARRWSRPSRPGSARSAEVPCRRWPDAERPRSTTSRPCPARRRV